MNFNRILFSRLFLSLISRFSCSFSLLICNQFARSLPLSTAICNVFSLPARYNDPLLNLLSFLELMARLFINF